MSVIFLVGLLSALMLMGPRDLAWGAEGQSIPERTVPGEYIVKFRHNVSTQKVRTLAQDDLGVVVKKMLNPHTWVLKFGADEEPEAIMAKIKRREDVAFVEPNGYVSLLYRPNDPLYLRHLQWNFGQLGVHRAWNYSRGKGTVVAVVDTGVATRLEDFKQTRFKRGYDFVNGDRSPFDDNGHGSHVAGTIAQSTNNRQGVAGIAFRATIMPIKVLNSGGYGTFSDVADGVRWAARHGAHVINLSLGSSSPSSAMKEAVDYARYKKHVVVVAAAGNGGRSGLSYPAAYPSVMAVSATTMNKALAWYSSWGNGLAVAAPGGDTGADVNHDGHPDGILQQTISSGHGRYSYFQGTSMATPHVSAIAALVRAQGEHRAGEIIHAIEHSAFDLGAPGYDTKYGWGLVNAYNAVRYRALVAPRFINPKGVIRVKKNKRFTISWDRNGANYLRYRLAYSSNPDARGSVRADFEAGSISSPLYSSGYRWAATKNTAAQGSYSARSGDIGDSQTSELSLSARSVASGRLSFAYKVSSEAGYDYLDVYVDGARRLHRSGNVGWTNISIPVKTGQHSVRWIYSKDYSISEGLDAAFVDNIKLTNVSKAKWHNFDFTKRNGSAKRWRIFKKAGSYRWRIQPYNGFKFGSWVYQTGRVIIE
jgi:serine protease